MTLRNLLKIVLLAFLVSPAHKVLAYEGGTLKNHNHTSAAGDGGRLSNLYVTGSSTMSITVGTYTATVSTIATLGATGTPINSFEKYRRPVLQYGSGTTVSVESGLNGTSGDVQILFPDNDLRTVNNTVDTTLAINRIAISTSPNAGGNQSGLVYSASPTNNTWYAVYAQKTSGVSTDFVVVASTYTPIQANYAELNSKLGVDSWVYLGMIRYGDNGSTANAILKFKQAGNLNIFYNPISSADTGISVNSTGIIFSSGSATSITYTYVAGTSAREVPSNIDLVKWTAIGPADLGGDYRLSNAANSYNIIRVNCSGVANIKVDYAASEGVRVDNSSGSSNAYSLMLAGFWDRALGIGANPRL